MQLNFFCTVNAYSERSGFNNRSVKKNKDSMSFKQFKQHTKKQHRRYLWSALFEGDIQTGMWLGNSRSESLLIFCWEYEFQ